MKNLIFILVMGTMMFSCQKDPMVKEEVIPQTKSAESSESLILSMWPERNEDVDYRSRPINADMEFYSSNCSGILDYWANFPTGGSSSTGRGYYFDFFYGEKIQVYDPGYNGLLSTIVSVHVTDMYYSDGGSIRISTSYPMRLHMYRVENITLMADYMYFNIGNPYDWNLIDDCQNWIPEGDPYNYAAFVAELSEYVIKNNLDFTLVFHVNGDWDSYLHDYLERHIYRGNEGRGYFMLLEYDQENW